MQTLHTDGNVCEIDWAPDGKTLAAAQTTHAIQCWDGLQGKLLHTLTGHEDTVYEVSWSPNAAGWRQAQPIKLCAFGMGKPELCFTRWKGIATMWAVWHGRRTVRCLLQVRATRRSVSGTANKEHYYVC